MNFWQSTKKNHLPYSVIHFINHIPFLIAAHGAGIRVHEKSHKSNV